MEKVPVGIDVAKNINRSKELGIFISEFSPKEVVLNDSLKFEIVSAWVEYNIYSTDVEHQFQKAKNWSEGNQWKLKEDFDPINKGHFSFLVKGHFKERFKDYGGNWKFDYCQLIGTSDTTISNNYTYFKTYGPVSYDSLTTKIKLNFEYYIHAQDTTKYGKWVDFGEFYLTKK
ncbi:hypothetical protein [Adhaeribacter pallidiroseus]|nr:hypothetical protein [Adhaeribacter pallidiroseus]